MAWSEFDFEHSTWTLPAARSKNGRAHMLPLLPAMLAVIKAVPRMASRDQLFGQRANGFTGWSRGKTGARSACRCEKLDGARSSAEASPRTWPTSASCRTSSSRF